VLTGAGSNSRAITGEKSLGGTLSGTEPEHQQARPVALLDRTSSPSR
jgi:hypothetical protein